MEFDIEKVTVGDETHELNESLIKSQKAKNTYEKDNDKLKQNLMEIRNKYNKKQEQGGPQSKEENK